MIGALISRKDMLVSSRGGMPATAGVIFDGRFKPFDDWLGNSRSLEAAMSFGMACAAEALLSEDGKSVFAGFEASIENIVFSGSVEAGYRMDGSSRGEVAILSAEDSEFLRLCVVSRKQAEPWVVDLVACYKVAPLADRNIRSYFMGRDSTSIDGGKVAKVLAFAYRSFPNFVSNGELRDALVTDTFVRYHTAASATPHLLHKVVSELAQDASVFFTQDELNAIETAFTNVTDLQLTKNISERSIVIAGAYLEANSFNFGTWYQLARARQNAPSALFDVARSFFLKRKALISSMRGVEDADNLDDLMKNVPKIIQS